MQQRADLIKLYVDGGIINIKDIKNHYNSFGLGGDLLKAGASFIPGVGTVIDGIDLIKDPSWKNAGYFVGSLASDVLGLTAIKGLAKTAKTLKAIETIATAEKASTASKYAKLASKKGSIDKLNNVRKSAKAAGDRGRAYYDNLVANRKLLEAKVAADNAEAKFKLATGVNVFYDSISQGVQTLNPYLQYDNKEQLNKFENGGNTNNSIEDNTESKSRPLKTLFNKTRENKALGVVAPIIAMQQMLLEAKEERQSNEELAKELGIDYNGEIFKVPDDLAERDFVTRANEQIKTKTDAELKNELKSKSYDDLINIQSSLASEGYYDITLQKGKSKQASEIQRRLVKEGLLTQKDVDGDIGKQTITALQTMLVKKGYLPEFTDDGRENIDGFLGKRTQEAFKLYNRDYNIDGELGSRTINAYLEKENRKQKGFNTHVSAEGMQDQCAAWVSKKFDTVTGKSKQNGVYGNAWQMLKNVEDAGGQMLFNLYEDAAFSNMKSGNQIKNTVDKLVKTKNFDYSQLQAGDVVGIHNPSSLHYDDVLKEGTTYNTHVGIIADVQNGIPIVEHNIGGKVRRERIDKLTGSLRGKPTVTVASRPKQGESLKGVLSFDNIKSDLKLPTTPNEEMQEYMNSLASSKSTFKQIYPSVDMDFIEKAAVAIIKRETNFMEDKQSDVRKGSAGIKSAATANLRSLIHAIEGTPEESKSQDLTKMKYSSLGSQYRAAIGLTDPEQLSNDPTITGRAVMLLLSKNYDYFKRLAKENPSLKLTEEDIRNATILSYNRGIGSTSTLGFNKDGSPNFEEIKYLREKSKVDAKEKDISATNLKYLSKLGDSAGIFGNWLYDNYGEEHTPYVAAANKILQKLNENN